MAKMVINAWDKKSTINRNIYGHFAEHLGRGIYDGIFVGEDSPIKNVNGMRGDVVKALRNIRIPVLRWPGGCFADAYHWRDGVGPREARKKMVNSNWGGVVEDNSFGTHEFMELCRQLECEPYICGNVGSGTVQEMSEWIEYLTFDGTSPMADLRAKNGRPEPWKIKYWGVGNENWGCGGMMTPTQYGEAYRTYRAFCRNHSGNRLYHIAGGPNVDDYDWTEGVMKTAAYGERRPLMSALSLHYYTQPNTWENKKFATDFNRRDYYKALERSLRIEELIIKHCEIMSRYDPDHKIDLIVDEWGTWYETEPGTNPAYLYQQNTMRDALVAAVHFDIFNRHADRLAMANLAQMVNVLQAVILTEGEKMLLTPTYHAFELYKAHQDATLIDSWLETVEIGEEDAKIPSLSHSVSLKEDVITITVSNLSPDQAETVDCYLLGHAPKSVSARILSAEMAAHNTFDYPENVFVQTFTGVDQTGQGLKWTLPPCCIAEITVAK